MNRVDFRLSIGAEGPHRVFGQQSYQRQCRITHLPHSFQITIMELSFISRREKRPCVKVQVIESLTKQDIQYIFTCKIYIIFKSLFCIL